MYESKKIYCYEEGEEKKNPGRDLAGNNDSSTVYKVQYVWYVSHLLVKSFLSYICLQTYDP